MSLPKQNIVIAKEQDARLRFTNSSTNTVSGYTLAFTVRPLGDDAILTKTVGSGIAITGSSGAWVITVTILAADTDSVTTNTNYQWSLWRTDSGSTYPLADGDILFKDSAQIG